MFKKIKKAALQKPTLERKYKTLNNDDLHCKYGRVTLNTRGRGFWKLTTSLLKDEEYIKKIQSIITQTKDEYAQDNTVTPNLLWEMIKMKIRETSIEFGK